MNTTYYVDLYSRYNTPVFESTSINTLELQNCDGDDRIAVDSINYVYSGDYSNFGIVGKANYKYIEENFSDLLGIALWDVRYNFGCGIVVRSDILDPHFDFDSFMPIYTCADEEIEDLRDKMRKLADEINALTDYPVFDEEQLSQFEDDDFQDSWESFYRSDFDSAIADHLNLDSDDIGLSDEKLDMLFWQACEDAGNYPEPDGDNMWIDVERLAKTITLEMVNS